MILSLQINISLPEDENMPSYAKFMKELFIQKAEVEERRIYNPNGSCNVIFQRRLPPKKNELGCFNSIEKLCIKETMSSLGESINLTSSSMLRKTERVQVKQSNITLIFHQAT